MTAPVSRGHCRNDPLHVVAFTTAQDYREFLAAGELCTACCATKAARSSGPMTSIAAARKRAGSWKGIRFRLLQTFQQATALPTGDLNGWEAFCLASGISESNVWKRISELEDAGLIVYCGYDRPGQHGDQRRVYRITPLGQQVLATTVIP